MIEITTEYAIKWFENRRDGITMPGAKAMYDRAIAALRAQMEQTRMPDEAKRLVDALREQAEWAKANDWETPNTLGDNLEEAAGMIEKLSSERDAWKRRTEAAERDMAEYCSICKYYVGAMCLNTKCRTVIKGFKTGWKWRGPCEENGGAEDGNQADQV